MRFLANENFPGEAVRALRDEGHDVIWVREVMPGSNDRDVLQKAQDEQRILITFDKDFGELAIQYGLPASSGVILFRIPTRSARFIAQSAKSAIAQREDWRGHFSVVEEGRIRMTRLK